MHDFGGESEKVRNITLERFINEHNIQDIRLVKFNCEGAELGILMNTPTEVLNAIKNMVVLYHFDLDVNFNYKDLKQKRKEASNVKNELFALN